MLHPHPRPTCRNNCFGCKLRTLQFAAAPAMQPHFNHSVGQYINSDREFRDALKRSSERNSIATGIDHDYQPRYPGDTEVPHPGGEAGDALEKTIQLTHDAAH